MKLVCVGGRPAASFRPLGMELVTLPQVGIVGSRSSVVPLHLKPWVLGEDVPRALAALEAQDVLQFGREGHHPARTHPQHQVHRLDEEDNQQARLSLRFKTGRFEDYATAAFINLDQSASNEVLSAANVNGIALFNLSPAAGTAVLGGACTQAVTLNDDFMVYVSQTRAYIPGGINVLIQGATNLPNYKPIFDPQIVLAREVGAKLDFRLAGMVGRINVAAYKYDFTNIAVGFSGFTGTTSIAYTANVAAAKLKGFEIYGNLIPFERWQIRAAYNYNDAYYTDWTASDPHNAARPGDAICSPISQPQTCLIDLTNNPFVRMPKNQGHVSVSYSPPIGDDHGRLNLSATVYAQSLVWFNSSAYRLIQVLPTAKPGISQKAYSVLNLRADWSDVWGSGVDAALFVNNATDKVYALAQTPQLLTLGFSVATYAPPRMIGLELAKRF